MVPELVPSGCMPMPWGFSSNADPGLTMTIFMTGSYLGIGIIYGDYLVTRHFCNGSELLASSYYKPYRPIFYMAKHG